ncbi:MAG: GDP-mannose 4,6-dehydratase [Candidatus Heimdallarchaeota archaeon]|nr:GDP-mannose 4,6-dehydratase [Candidatus Heimdallarchaeota archaeon]
MDSSEKWVLISGGFGLIGSNLVKYLYLTTTCNFFIIDDLSSGNIENLREINSDKNRVIVLVDKVENVTQEIIDKYSLEISVVVHFASRASPKDFHDFPIDIMMANSMGTKNMLDIALSYKARFIFASTSEVYGDPLEHPQDETYRGNVSPIGIRSCYDESKRFSEALIDTYRRKYNLKTLILRIFNTYGEEFRENDGRVIPNFLFNALKDQNLIIHGNGEQTRSFCHVKDLVKGISKIMNVENAYGEIFNIGNPEEISINDLAKLIISITGSKSELIFKEIDVFDPRKRLPNIEKIQRYINWKPKITLKEGLKSILENIH